MPTLSGPMPDHHSPTLRFENMLKKKRKKKKEKKIVVG